MERGILHKRLTHLRPFLTASYVFGEFHRTSRRHLWKGCTLQLRN